MRILTLDFETYDPNLLLYGQGSCFKYHYQEVEFEVVGCGLIDSDNRELYIDFTVSTHIQCLKLRDIINEHDAILCHNSLYDIAILKYLFSPENIWKDKVLLDTQIMAKHDNQSRSSYSLEDLCIIYECDQKKGKDILHDYAWMSGIYKKEIENRQDSIDEVKNVKTPLASKKKRYCHTRPSKSTLNKFCMGDMRRFPIEIVREYCLQDVRATRSLYMILSEKLTYLNFNLDSDILKTCIEAKFNGVRIDLNKAAKLNKHFTEIASTEESIVRKLLNYPLNFNINSNMQLASLLIEAGYKLPVTELGNSSLRSDWLQDQQEDIYLHIRRYRKALKVNEYIDKLLLYQEVIPKKYISMGIGWLYPSLRPYGATATGRFSSGGGKGCRELSIQQIPKRDEEFGAPIRELFLAHEGEQIVYGDYSAQESRIQVHHAVSIGCTGAARIAQLYKDTPTIDYHQLVASICSIDRDHAKVINLGLSYGMGKKKLLIKLNVDIERGIIILQQYYKLLPFMDELQRIVAKTMQKNGFIKLMDSSRLYLGEGEYAYKALNKLAQGNAGVQCRMAMISALKQGLKILFSVHDEIVISSSNPIKDSRLLKECMERSVDSIVNINVPMWAEVGYGDNWGQCKINVLAEGVL